MDQEQYQFMTLRRLPARLTARQVAWLLGFQEPQISVLVSVGALEPLGSPAQNAQKIFARDAIQSLENDVKWLDKSSRKVGEYWKRKNARRSTNHLKVLDGGEPQKTAVRHSQSQIPLKM